MRGVLSHRSRQRAGEGNRQRHKRRAEPPALDGQAPKQARQSAGKLSKWIYPLFGVLRPLHGLLDEGAIEEKLPEPQMALVGRPERHRE